MVEARTGMCIYYEDYERDINAKDAEIERLKATVQPLVDAAEEFIRKVESGEARSVRSYKQFKEALSDIRKELTNG
jgi:predicted RNase H-like nuclease (RuvC/YqgF family)